MEKEISYPARINKYLAHQKLCTRREADQLVAAGMVKINGRMAVLGDKVRENDAVTVDQSGRKAGSFVYLAYNKPRGIVTHSPQAGEKAIADVFHFPRKVFPVGRLDKDSYGLIILTDDGRVTDRLLNPENDHEKEYRVKVDRTISPGFLRNLSQGVVLDDGYQTKPARVEKLDEVSFNITLTEGKRRQIRRMCERLERRVLDLRRTRIMSVKLGGLKAGEAREIKGRELAEFLASIGLD